MSKDEEFDKSIKLISDHMWDRNLFDRAEKAGVHVTPVHFYSPIPNVSELPDQIWSRPSGLAGVDLNESRQLSFLHDVFPKFKQEYSQFPRHQSSNPHQYYLDQMMFRSVDAEVLYCMTRHFLPKHFVEVGSGFSTLLTAQALRKNSELGSPGYLTAIEPFPSDLLRAGFPGLDALRIESVQKTDPAEFARLKPNDILFIDSSHVVRIGSDVLFLFLEVLPKLQAGVVIHIHDIFLPAEYPKEWVQAEHRFWAEQYLLHAFLLFNSGFEVLWAGSYMHMKHSRSLTKVFPSYVPDEVWPGSFWIRKIS